MINTTYDQIRNFSSERATPEEVHTKTNNERFNQMLNRCKHPRRVYAAPMAFIEPSVEQANDVLEKRKIIIGDLLTKEGAL